MQQHAHSSVAFLTVLPTDSQESGCLSDTEKQFAASLILRDTVFSQTLTTLTTGAFMTGLALQLKADYLLTGLLLALPSLAQLFQLTGAYWTEQSQSPRKVTLFATTISRLCLLPTIVAPFMPSRQQALSVLLIAYALHACMGAAATCAWNTWMKEIINPRQLGSFFSRRLALATLVAMLITIGGGAVLNGWTQIAPTSPRVGYSLLLGVACLAGLIGLFPLRHMPEALVVKMKPSFKSWVKQILEPFYHSEYQPAIRFLALWNFVYSLATTAWTIYLLGVLHIPVLTVSLLSILVQVANLVSLPYWGKMTDQCSNKTVLNVSAPLFLTCVLGFAMISVFPAKSSVIPMLMIFILPLQLLLGMAQAGITLTNGNMPLKLLPSGKTASCYLAGITLTTALSTGLAPLAGGLLVDFIKRSSLGLVLKTLPIPGIMPHLFLNPWTLLFLSAFGLGLLSLPLLQRITETGERPNKSILNPIFSIARKRKISQGGILQPQPEFKATRID